jgi:hypothetical protein
VVIGAHFAQNCSVFELLFALPPFLFVPLFLLPCRSNFLWWNAMHADVRSMSFSRLSPTLTMLDISDCCINTPESEFGPIQQLRYLPNLETLDLSRCCFDDEFGPPILTAIRGLASLTALRALNLVNSTFLMELMTEDTGWGGVSLPLQLTCLTSLKLSQPDTKLWTWWETHNSIHVFDASVAAWRRIGASVKQVRFQLVDAKIML